MQLDLASASALCGGFDAKRLCQPLNSSHMGIGSDATAHVVLHIQWRQAQTLLQQAKTLSL